MISIQPGSIVDNKQLVEIFGCSTQGGMRRSHKTNSLVLVSNHLKSLYDDRWIDDEFHYTGMGTEGDQSLNYMQNKTLSTSNVTGIQVHLFEVFEDKQYTYIGEVYLAGSPYKEIQLDSLQQEREVYIFPLKLINSNKPIISASIIHDLLSLKEQKSKRLSDAELKRRANKKTTKAGTRQVNLTQYDRDPYISEYTKRRANGICQLCKEPAPFKNKKGEPYLETHHIEWLSKGGEDSIQNTVALCPNCHRKMHIMNSNDDKLFLKEQNSQIML